MTDATPTQPTGSGKLIWRKPLIEDVVEFGTAPDPRDARIAELEAALQAIVALADDFPNNMFKLDLGEKIARAALMPSPECDMRVTVEEWDA